MYAWHLDSHNAGLELDYRYANRAMERANERVRGTQTLEQLSQVMKESNYENLARDAVHAERRLSYNSSSSTWIILLWRLGGLSFLAGFVLIIVGLVLPEQNKP